MSEQIAQTAHTWLTANWGLLLSAARAASPGTLQFDETDDVVQDAALAIWRHWEDGFDFRLGTREAWAATIARRKAIDHYRQRQRRHAAASRLARQTQLEEPCESQTVDAELAAEQREELRHVWTKLTDDEQRMVILLASGRTMAQAATQLAWPLGTLKSRAWWMRRRLAGATVRRNDCPG